MKQVKRFAVAVLVVCAVSASAAMAETAGAAQPPKARQGMAALDLTSDQKARIKEIRESAKSQVEAVQQDAALSAEAKQAKLKEIRKASEEQVRAVLTPDQQQKLKEMNSKAPVQTPRMPAPGSRITEKLSLTADQQARIKGIREAATAQIEAVRKDTSLSAEARQAKLKEIRRSVEEQIRAVLTPEQQQQLREMNGKAPVQAPAIRGAGKGIMAELNLTEDQKARIQSINQSAQLQIGAVRNDISLTRDDRAARLKSIRETTMSQIRALLTPEQQQKLDAAQSPRQKGEKSEKP